MTALQQSKSLGWCPSAYGAIYNIRLGCHIYTFLIDRVLFLQLDGMIGVVDTLSIEDLA